MFDSKQGAKGSALNFDGVSSAGDTYPDANLAVGATQVMQWVYAQHEVL